MGIRYCSEKNTMFFVWCVFLISISIWSMIVLYQKMQPNLLFLSVGLDVEKEQNIVEKSEKY